MGKQKPAEAPKTAEKTEAPETNAHYIKEAMQALGQDNSAPAEVFQWITNKYPQYRFSESSIKQGCTKVREELGYKPLRNRAGGEVGNGKRSAAEIGEPTLSDIMEAQTLCHTLGMPVDKLLTHVTEMKAFDSLEKLEACLKAIQTIQAGKGK